MNISKQYNYIYDALVTEPDDITGLVAYGIYKRQKIEFIRKFEKEKGYAPSDKDCEAFVMIASTESQLKSYKLQAEITISEIVGAVLGESMQKYKQELLEDYQSNIKKSLPPWWETIILGAISALTFSILAGAFFFIGATSEKQMYESTIKLIETVNHRSEESPKLEADSIANGL